MVMFASLHLACWTMYGWKTYKDCSICNTCQKLYIHNINRLQIIWHGCIEAQGLPIEIELAVQSTPDSWCRSESMLLSLEQNQRCRYSFLFDCIVHYLCLVWGHNFILQPLKTHDKKSQHLLPNLPHYDHSELDNSFYFRMTISDFGSWAMTKFKATPEY